MTVVEQVKKLQELIDSGRGHNEVYARDTDGAFKSLNEHSIVVNGVGQVLIIP